MVPVGAGTCLDTFENADDAYASFKGDEEGFKSYLDECSQMGFTVDTKLNGHNYDAYVILFAAHFANISPKVLAILNRNATFCFVWAG